MSSRLLLGNDCAVPSRTHAASHFVLLFAAPETWIGRRTSRSFISNDISASMCSFIVSLRQYNEN